jgi:hypothetical protein
MLGGCLCLEDNLYVGWTVDCRTRMIKLALAYFVSAGIQIYC